ncbi:hypothetical protein SAY86_022781 [Trapa natans]|uniref:Uncharacterized protein n=1 Tax=Trapa natans TaxID=22666 RepID=A0AAN7R9K7_TRANT|nr:hypothetical protein SAY86_022781 [Trapa natans]
MEEEKEEDERREAAIASAPALQPDFKSSGVTKDQLSKFQELHRRRLQIKAKSKKQKGQKGIANKFKWIYSSEKCWNEKDLEHQGSSLCDSEIPTQQSIQQKDVKLKTQQKLHWGSMVHAMCTLSPNSLWLRSPHCHQASRKAAFPVRLGASASSLDNSSSMGLKVEYIPWLIVGLGNPGNKYHGTRHNIGFEMIDHISEAEGISMNITQFKALIGIGSFGEVPVLLVKPQTYMNFSGEAIGPLAAYYQVPMRHILLAYDEMSLPNGVLRVQQKGGHGHHNGVKSAVNHLDGRREFPRLCIGIGNPPGTMDVKAFLLQKFNPVEREQIDTTLRQGVEAARTLILHGFDQKIDRFNLVQKYKYHKV